MCIPHPLEHAREVLQEQFHCLCVGSAPAHPAENSPTFIQKEQTPWSFWFNKSRLTAQRKVWWPYLKPHMGQHLHRSWAESRDPLWEYSSHLGFASAWLSLGSGQLAELAVKRIQLLLQLYHPWLLHWAVFWGWIHISPGFWQPSHIKEGKIALGGASSVCRACFALSQTPAPLGTLTKQSRTASSSELQIPTDFLPCPLILAQHSSFSCKARKGSKKPRSLSIFMFSRWKSVQCRFLFPE